MRVPHDTDSSEAYVSRAIVLAARAAEEGDVPVGAVLLAGGRVYEAWNRRESTFDPTAHAEVLALREACAAARSWRLAGARLYVTKEPCVMCAGAIVAARVERVVFGCSDAKGGGAGGALDVFASTAALHHVRVESGVLATETAAQLQRFFLAKRRSAERERPI